MIDDTLQERMWPEAYREHPLVREAESAVRRLDASMGRSFDQVSERMTASLASLAREQGFNHIDHVVLSQETSQSRQGENVFVVQGDVDSPARRVAYMKTQLAVEAPIEQSMGRLLAADAVMQPTSELELAQQSRRGMAIS